MRIFLNYKNFLFFALVIIPLSATQAGDITVKPEQKRIYLSKKLEFLVDKSNQLEIKNFLEPGGNFAFQASRANAPNFGYTDHPVWVRFTLNYKGTQALERLLEYNYGLVDSIIFYEVKKGKLVRSRRTGRLVPYQERDLPNRYFIFKIKLEPDTETTIYLRLQSEDSLNAPLLLWEKSAFNTKINRGQFFFGVYYGLILVTILYNLGLFYFMREKSNLFYVFVLIFLHFIFQMSLNGILPDFTPMDSLWLSRETIALALGFGLFFALLFCRSFLMLGTRAPHITPYLYGLMGLNALQILSVFFIPYFYAIQFGVLLGMTSILAFLAVGFHSIRSGFRPARFFLLAWSSLIFGGGVYALKAWGLLESNFFTEFGLQIGSGMEAVLLSLALGDKYQLLKQETLAAQKNALEQERAAGGAKSELLRHLENAEKIKDEILTIEESDSTAFSLDRLLEKILHGLDDIIGFEKGLVVISDRNDQVHACKTGDVPLKLVQMMSSDNFINRLLRGSDDVFSELNQVRYLKNQPAPLFPPESPVSRRNPEMIQSINELIEGLRENALGLILPLSHRQRIFGYLIMGERRDGRDYSKNELKSLDTLRFSIALAIRNATQYQEIIGLKGRAEEKVTRLSEYISGYNQAVNHKLSGKNLVYASPEMTAVFEKARKYAEQIQPILITGPTGTGKEIIAQTVHEQNEGETGPFVPINCAAIPMTLWESEIFGYEKGAFTDARKSYAGRVEQAAGGTLFFDEIGEMPLEIQPKLLRLIQERKLSRVGGDREIEADCRFIFATNRNLLEEQQKGRFREDLYYRISVLEIKVPVLRERQGDIPALVQHFIEKYAGEFNSSVTTIEPEALDILHKYPWPGNIRELENSMIHAIIHATGKELMLEDFPPALTSSKTAVIDGGGSPQPEQIIYQPGQSFDDSVREYSRQIILNAIERNSGNKIKAAQMLGVKRATFYYKLKELGIN